MTYLAQSRLRTRSSFKFTSSAFELKGAQLVRRFVLPPPPAEFSAYRLALACSAVLFVSSAKRYFYWNGQNPCQPSSTEALLGSFASGFLVRGPCNSRVPPSSRERKRSNHLARYPVHDRISSFRHPDRVGRVFQRAPFFSQCPFFRFSHPKQKSLKQQRQERVIVIKSNLSLERCGLSKEH